MVDSARLIVGFIIFRATSNRVQADSAPLLLFFVDGIIIFTGASPGFSCSQYTCLGVWRLGADITEERLGPDFIEGIANLVSIVLLESTVLALGMMGEDSEC